MIYPFVKEPASIEEIERSHAVRLYRALERENGNVKALTNDEKELIESVFSELWHPDTYTQGVYRISGYVVNFNQYLKTYWIQNKYHGIRQVKSFNKGYVRKLAVTPNHILKIVEVSI